MKYAELFEGLIWSMPRESLVSFLKSRFKNDVMVVSGDPHNHATEYMVGIYFPGDKFTAQVHADTKRILNTLGWYASNMFLNRQHFQDVRDILDRRLTKRDTIIYNIEPKYDVLVDDIPRYVYHATPLQHVDKIKTIGLVPRTKNKLSRYPNRIYVSNTREDAESIRRQLSDYDGYHYVLFQIDTSKLVSGTKFFIDPNFTSHGRGSIGMYTLSNIPPNALSLIKS